MFDYFLAECRSAGVGIHSVIFGLIWLGLILLLPVGYLWAILVHRNVVEVLMMIFWTWMLWDMRLTFVPHWPSHLWEAARVTKKWHEEQQAEAKRILAAYEEESMHPLRRW